MPKYLLFLATSPKKTCRYCFRPGLLDAEPEEEMLMGKGLLGSALKRRGTGKGRRREQYCILE